MNGEEDKETGSRSAKEVPYECDQLERLCGRDPLDLVLTIEMRQGVLAA